MSTEWGCRYCGAINGKDMTAVPWSCWKCGRMRNNIKSTDFTNCNCDGVGMCAGHIEEMITEFPLSGSDE